jgi:hypothetical protein
MLLTTWTTPPGDGRGIIKCLFDSQYPNVEFVSQTDDESELAITISDRHLEFVRLLGGRCPEF